MSRFELRVVVVLACLLLCFLSVQTSAKSSGDFSIKVNALTIDLPQFSVFVLPGDTLRVAVEGAAAEVVVEHGSKDFSFAINAENIWQARAPANPGLYSLIVRQIASGNVINLNIFVMQPFANIRDEKLNAYRIGNYPEPRAGRNNYDKPSGFIEVTAANVDTPLSPHFTLRQFLCKQKSSYPKYVVIQEKLLFLLEDLLQQVRDHGFAIDTFGFISAYRTPFYNQQINNVKYSRHVYGDAADIFIDQNRDGRLDDLNEDGVIDRRDAKMLFDIASRFKEEQQDTGFSGGLGLYSRNSRHSGFIHVDTRGYRARW